MAAKHGKLVNLLTRTHLLQSQYKTNWKRLEAIQGHTFGITEKPTRDYILLYRPTNVGFRVGNFEGKVW